MRRAISIGQPTVPSPFHSHLGSLRPCIPFRVSQQHAECRNELVPIRILGLHGAVLAGLTGCNAAELLHWIWACGGLSALEVASYWSWFPKLNKTATLRKVACMKFIPALPRSVCGHVTVMCQRPWKAGNVEIREPQALLTGIFRLWVCPKPIILRPRLATKK